MLTRLMFGGGGTVQVLLMQAVKKPQDLWGFLAPLAIP